MEDNNLTSNTETIQPSLNGDSSFITDIVISIIDKVTLPTIENEEQKRIEFYEHLMNVIKTQENILNMTGVSKQKLSTANDVANTQLKTVKEKFNKYGKYLKLIQTELFTISDLMKKIKIEVQNKK